MRTTITLDPDTLTLLKKEMVQSQVSFKRAVNDAIRRGLAGGPPAAPSELAFMPFRSDYQPGVDRRRLQQLADEMEIDEAALGTRER
jgi:hypothetical protein